MPICLAESYMISVVMIGMPGSGKSTIGVLLAKTLGLDFLDLDLEIQRREGRLLQEIINEKGLAYFLKAEEEAALSLVYKNAVIAPGGSMVYSEKAMARFSEDTVIVYLKLGCGKLLKRLKNITTRGIAMQPGQSFKELYRERTALYEKYAHITVDCDNKSLEEVVTWLSEALPKAPGGESPFNEA